MVQQVCTAAAARCDRPPVARSPRSQTPAAQLKLERQSRAAAMLQDWAVRAAKGASASALFAGRFRSRQALRASQ